MGLADNIVNRYINLFFYEDMETGYDEFTDEPVLSATIILNHIIEYEFIPNKMYESISIMEGDNNLTYCILDSGNIEIIDVS